MWNDSGAEKDERKEKGKDKDGGRTLIIYRLSSTDGCAGAVLDDAVKAMCTREDVPFSFFRAKASMCQCWLSAPCAAYVSGGV
jgi:hypothetical protein